MRILWIVPYLPWPTTSGGKTRQYHLLRTLSERGHRITLLAQSKTPADDAAHVALEPLLERLIVVPRRPLKHPLTLLAGVFAPWPLLTTVNGLSAPLQAQFAQLLNEHWDVIQMEHSYSLQPFMRTLQQRRRAFVLTEHNLESSLGGATYDRFPKWAAPFVQYDQWRCRQWERKAFDAAAHVIAVTEADAQAMRPLSSSPVSVVVNGVDSRAFAEVNADAQSQRLLFVGNYEYAPNLDAVQWLLEEIFPRVWRQCPNARLAVAGYGLPEHWRNRWPDERIEWLGFVPDLCALQRRCAGFVAALRHGGGSKLKVLEAMAAGLPLVSTAQGVSGLAVQPQAHYLAGESAEALADAIVHLLDEPSLARQLADAARVYARQYHDWAVAGNELEHIYRTLLTSEEPQPCA
ncbi:glycosyltransferase family 4 protein [Pseudomonas synxantha]|uniref:glycosyltransferase family 4 protein n=1 Tax=Pseudomonas synxantha TaxID=47883 RepID=UPI000F5856DD|nr:glycosyltransferase family 4 protein [Pseudomonas synxantha]AZE77833.1 Pellicle/biofilm biosynthesis protein PslH, CAZy glycosyltransferase family 4 [Pseudomonas synxantha]